MYKRLNRKMVSSISQLNEFIGKIPMVDTIKFLHKNLGKQGVKISYERQKNKYTRIMFGTFNRSCSFEFPNIILGAFGDKLKVISVPCRPPMNQYNKNVFNDIKNYEAIKVKDGTTVTLYYYNKWVISTFRGYEVNEFKCCNGKTWEQNLNEVLKKYNFNFDRLDRNKSYTIGFTHTELHPFNNENSAWFIQSVKLDEFNNSKYNSNHTEDIGLPLQEKMKYETIGQLFKKSKYAYDKYLSTKEIDFGYIVNIDNKQYLIESTLLRNIRKILYANKFNDLDKNIDKTKYITINCILDAGLSEMFRNLFPKYQNEIEKVNSYISTIAKNIIIIANQHKINGNVNTNSIEHSLYLEMSKNISFTDRNENSIKALVYIYLYDTKFTDIFYKEINK